MKMWTNNEIKEKSGKFEWSLTEMLLLGRKRNEIFARWEETSEEFKEYKFDI